MIWLHSWLGALRRRSRNASALHTKWPEAWAALSMISIGWRDERCPAVAAGQFSSTSNVTKHELLGYSQNHAALSRWDRLKNEWIRTQGDSWDFVPLLINPIPGSVR